MSIQALSAVQDLIDELTPDEYRLLSVIAQSGALSQDFIWPNWEYVLRMTRFTQSQCVRMLRGLSNDGFVKFAGTDVLNWIRMSDPRMSITLDGSVSIWIAGMPWNHEPLRFHRDVYKKVPIPNEIRKAVFARDDHTCRHCGATFDLAVDHIYPESKGGTMDMDNLQTLCFSCNSRKGAKVQE